ncbi:ComEA family DNA-binding protein [Nonomuraea angiospora]|uniref:ComEA family DNA-binding protein n=1 Tax=Nonomuraea angiospora TaxID=46172 RepID=UPI00344B6AB1
MTVHVTGKIRKPGVYLLPAGARVTDAVAAAGGVSRGASPGALNLARRLIDGEQIVVGAPAGQATQAAPSTDPATTVLDLNSATTDQLEQLPGVGEVLAARIAEFRDTHGGFTTVEQLREVTGIGPRKYDEIKPKVRV